MSVAAVASGHPCVSEAACEILRAGGNAFDAAVAGGFASAVAEPALTSIGGGGFLLARTADGRATLFDFFCDTPGRGHATPELEPHLVPVTVEFPGSKQVFHVGLGSVAVPGNLRGFLHVHGELGRMPLEDLLAPAVRLAREGVVLNARQAYFLDLLRPIKTLSESGRRLYQPGGRYLGEGDRFANPELACFLETLPRDGDGELYRGEVAREIASHMGRGQGRLTLADLDAYRVIERVPLRVEYRGFVLLTNPPPSFGGSLVALSLRLLEATPLASMRFGESAHLCRLVAAMQEVDRRRAEGLLDPGSLTAEQLRESVQRMRTASGGTTHLSVCDASGNVASMTTSNGEGSGYFAPGTGVMLNNMMGEDDLHPQGFHASPPGQRVASMMSPSVLLRDGEVRLVLGSGGSKRIRSAILQTVSNTVDFDMPVREAVEAPRLHWDGESVQIEPGFAAEDLAELRERWPANLWDVLDVYFGGVNALSPDGEGAGDPRRGGHAMVLP